MKICDFFKVGAFAAISFVSNATAQTINCSDLAIDSVVVEGARDDGNYFQNKLIIKLSEECGGQLYAHMDNQNPAFNGLLSMALTASTTQKPVNIGVNTNNTTKLSNQLAYISISAR